MRPAVLLFSGIFATAASAYTDIHSARRAYQAVTFGEFYAERAKRVEMAEAVHDYWSDFDSRLPRLSPSELEWLTGELDTTDMVRIDRVMRTREFSLWELGNLADQCIGAAKGLIAALETPAQHETEMFRWIKVASCYHGSDDSIFRYLKGAGLDRSGDAEDGHTLDHLMLSRILDIIIPSSMADTMGWTFGR